MVTAATMAISSFWCIFSFARIPGWRIRLPASRILRSQLPVPCELDISQPALRVIPRCLESGRAVRGGPAEAPIRWAPAWLCGTRRPDADQGPGPARRLEGDGPRGGLPLPGRRGADPELRRRQARRREARRPPSLEARPGDQGQPGLAADPRPPDRPGGGQDADHGGAAAPRHPPLSPARPPEALGEAEARGGDDQGGAAARQGCRRGGHARDRLRPLRLGRGQPERRPGGQGRRLLGPRVRAPDRGRQDRRPHHGGDDRAPDPDPSRASAGARP